MVKILMIKKNESIKTDSCRSQFLALATLIQKAETNKQKKRAEKNILLVLEGKKSNNNNNKKTEL